MPRNHTNSRTHVNASGSKKRDPYYEDRERWEKRVIADRTIPNRGARVASAMVMWFINREEYEATGNLIAFPSLKGLAAVSGMAEITVRRGVEDLANRGAVQSRRQGKMENNLYLLNQGDWSMVSNHKEGVSAQFRQSDCSPLIKVSAHHAAETLLIDSLDYSDSCGVRSPSDPTASELEMEQFLRSEPCQAANPEQQEQASDLAKGVSLLSGGLFLIEEHQAGRLQLNDSQLEEAMDICRCGAGKLQDYFESGGVRAS
jgi:hypothetical protein